ncbi:MAG: tetratricopeptide repeat protein [Thainema sp.]
MFDKQNRWLVSTVLIIAVVAFAGLSFSFVAPSISSALRRNNDSATDPNATATTEAQQSELATQAQGYELVLEREPDNQTALRGLIDTRIQLNDIEGIVEPLKKLVELNPGQPEYAVLLAQAQQQTGDMEGAAQTYRSALTERPGDMNALRGLTSLLVNQGRPQAAIGLLQDTLQTADQANQVKAGSVDVTSVKLLLGEVYAQQGRYDEAISLYDEAIESNAQDFRPVLSKAIVLQRQGKTEEAKSLFTTASALAPAEFKDQINQMAAGNSVLTPEAPNAEGEATEGEATAPAATETEVTPESDEAAEAE